MLKPLPHFQSCCKQLSNVAKTWSLLPLMQILQSVQGTPHNLASSNPWGLHLSAGRVCTAASKKEPGKSSPKPGSAFPIPPQRNCLQAWLLYTMLSKGTVFPELLIYEHHNSPPTPVWMARKWLFLLRSWAAFLAQTYGRSHLTKMARWPLLLCHAEESKCWFTRSLIWLTSLFSTCGFGTTDKIHLPIFL